MDNRAMLFADAKDLFTEVVNEFRRRWSGYINRPACTFENLPTMLTEGMTGYTYNVTNAFKTTALFIEGAGKEQDAGTNVMVVDASTYAAASPTGNENP